VLAVEPPDSAAGKRPRPKYPLNVLDEIERTLSDLRERMSADRRRVVALEELHALVRTLSFRLGRGVDVADILDTAVDPEERVRRRELLRMLRER